MLLNSFFLIEDAKVRSLKFLKITSFDGTVLMADASLPVGGGKFPVLIMANSWSVPQVESLGFPF